MTFVVNAIKQENDLTRTYEFLVDAPEEVIVRGIMQKAGMILLSISKYMGNKEDFGALHIKVVYDLEQYELVSSLSLTPKELCTFFIRAGFEVTDINSYVTPESLEHVQRIIALCKTTYEKELDDARLAKLKQEEEEKKKKLYEDKMLKKAKVSTNWLLDKLQVLLTTKRIHIPPKDQKWIDSQLNEIKKQRMGSNYEKIKLLLQDLFLFLNSLEDTHYTSLNTEGEVLFEGTSVRTYDLERQVEILEEIKYQSDFGGTILGWRKQYSTLPIFPYFLFIKKDFFALFDNIDRFFYRLYDFVLFFCITSGVIFAGVIFSNKIFSLGLNLTFLYYVSLAGGWLSLLLYIPYWFRKDKKYTFFIAALLGVAVVYFVTFPILENSFALR